MELRKAIEQQSEAQINIVKAIKGILMQSFIDNGGDVKDMEDMRSFYLNERPFRFIENFTVPIRFNYNFDIEYKYIPISIETKDWLKQSTRIIVSEKEIIVGDLKEVNAECIFIPFDFSSIIRTYDGLNELDMIEKMTDKQLSDYVKNRNK